jgi:chromosome segregation protein
LRLKHIHLAGFKSFVDPVTIPAPARLTGVVGPNGCGKSNVIDAVRWVLGESKARELRGESMQDVIFNGSSNRKPASRASVEMLFDNAEGRAAGQWSQYAEIAVKRVLTRAGESSYYINNLHVRRKDVFDLFLGTGLGGDAYAIIEQGMISRIIESKPDELRGYLEEAAGVSKYKERRKETEFRLRDTRENLSRVEDIRLELAGQLERLGVQAEVARRFFALDEERSLKTRFLALTRKRDAQVRQAELARQGQTTHTEIEAKVAELRHLEADLETLRLAQFEATEGVNQAQAHFYGESGEVARLEQELRHLHERRQRLGFEIESARGRHRQGEDELAATRAEIAQCKNAQVGAEEQAAMLAERATEAGGHLPEAEAAWRETQAAVAAVQQEIARHEQTAQLEESNAQHAEKAIERLKSREVRLLQERDSLAGQDADALARQQAELEEAQERVASLADYLEAARAGLPDREASQRQARQGLDAALREMHHLEAETNALRTLQRGAQDAERDGAAWLARAGLETVARLWQGIRVEPGWETAVEAALGEALAALAVELRPEWAESPPEARFELILPSPAGGGEGAGMGKHAESSAAAALPLTPPPSGEGDLNPLVELIHTDDPGVARFLADRLALAYATDSLAHALALRDQLPPGGFIATRAGHRVGHASLVFNAPEKGHHGLIARAREIERLESELEVAQARVESVTEAVAVADEALREGRRQADALQAQLTQAQRQAHELQVGVARGQEAARRVAERQAQIDKDLDELYGQLELEEESWNAAGERQREAELEQEFARERLDEARARRHDADQRFQSVRDAQRRAEREAQEAAFQVRALGSRMKELEARLARAERALAELATEQSRLETELGQLREESVNDTLVAALAQRQQAEAALTAAREALEGANARLQAAETARLGAERVLEPLRDRLQGIELKRQEAQLLEARYAEELEGVDEAALQGAVETAGIAARGEGWLKSELQRLEAGIAELGPVNMAALQELEATQERKNYLDAQAEDLNTAAATLEEAIRRIDAETRARLKDTFDAVSREYRALFTELFGGGEAQLILTGDEILDAGLMVMAQPPGKKNSSIHLLSGGEKALTALSLVFAFFRLNPAPFCLLDEVDAPLDDSNTERLCRLIAKMSAETQFMFITHNRITMELAQHLVGITMPEPGVSRPVAVDVEDALRLAEAA